MPPPSPADPPGPPPPDPWLEITYTADDDGVAYIDLEVDFFSLYEFDTLAVFGRAIVFQTLRFETCHLQTVPTPSNMGRCSFASSFGDTTEN